MIYFFFGTDQTTIKRFKNGRDSFSAQEPSVVAVRRKKNGNWKGVAVGNDAINLKHRENSGVFLCNPFRTRQLLLEDSDVAVEFVRVWIFQRILNPFLTILNPQVIMHLNVDPDNPLLPIEKRNLQDIALRAGAREVYTCPLKEMFTAQMLQMTKPMRTSILYNEGPKSQLSYGNP